MPLAPPRPKGLPLNALRALEAAARLESFVAAADELGVTAGAVAAHVKFIEQELGAALFLRESKGVRLTAAARRVLPDLVGAFDAMASAEARLREELAPEVIRIAALPAVAQLWLQPRLAAIRAREPKVSISITALESPPNLKRLPFDVSLFYRADEGQGLQLADDVVFPVAAPALAARLKTPADLVMAPCLIDAVWVEDWAEWARMALPGVSFAPRGPVFSLYAMAVAEALGGAGVLMAHEALVSEHLRSGRLVAPFAERARLGQSLVATFARPVRKGSALWRVMEALGAGRPSDGGGVERN